MDFRRARPYALRMENPHLILGTVRIELRGSDVLITRNIPKPGAPVVVPSKQLENWAKRVYRQGVV